MENKTIACDAGIVITTRNDRHSFLSMFLLRSLYIPRPPCGQSLERFRAPSARDLSSEHASPRWSGLPSTGGRQDRTGQDRKQKRQSDVAAAAEEEAAEAGDEDDGLKEVEDVEGEVVEEGEPELGALPPPGSREAWLPRPMVRLVELPEPAALPHHRRPPPPEGQTLETCPVRKSFASDCVDGEQAT
ncbi:hypothetical protein BHE74_00047726 [Ensete ventricosum]|nr:hypothetical protein BHE74_00047726 [Ensete ventricosum]